jgi:hypothetical protein
MSRTIGQIRDILHGTPRWKAGLHWYDFLLAIEFHQDGTGEMKYGENQGLRSDINFRYDIAADMQIHFEFFETIDAFWLPYRGKMFERTEKNALKTVAFQLLDGPFVIDEPYHQQHTYRYLLRFASDPFPEGEGPADESLLDYYGWIRDVSLGSKPPIGVQPPVRQPHRWPPAHTFAFFLHPTFTAMATQEVASALHLTAEQITIKMVKANYGLSAIAADQVILYDQLYPIEKKAVSAMLDAEINAGYIRLEEATAWKNLFWDNPGKLDTVVGSMFSGLPVDISF